MGKRSPAAFVEAHPVDGSLLGGKEARCADAEGRNNLHSALPGPKALDWRLGGRPIETSRSTCSVHVRAFPVGCPRCPVASISLGPRPRPCPHNPLGPKSLAAGLQIDASIPNFLCQEQVSLGEGYLKNPFKVRDGYVDLPTGPGLGIELDEEAMKDKIGHDWRNPETYDPDDGSVVDW